MGGNALKNTYTRRYGRDEYFEAWNEIKNFLWRDLHGFSLIPSYKTKESFGDMDILVDDVFFPKYKFTDNFIYDHFKSNEIVRNGDVISFNYKELQVDLIFTSTFDYSLAYFSYNDLGNLIGRLAHKFGLKHGHDGLVLPVRDNDHVYKEIVMTTNYANTLEFLNLDIATFQKGFDTLEDIFRYVSSSSYFRPEIYLFENLNNIQRTRDKKRPTYNKFLDWCKTQTFEDKEWYTSKTDALNYAISYFEENFGDPIREEYEKTFEEIAAKRYIASKFNGELVMNVTNLTGKALGNFMKHLRTNTNFKHNSFIMTKTDEQIIDNIRYEFLKGEN